MKVFLLHLVIIVASVSFPNNSSAQGYFDYNKWKARQQADMEKDEAQSFDENLLSPTTAYIDGFVQIGSLRGAGATIGGYYKNINLEVSYIYGLTESYQVERLFADARHAFTYRPTFFGIKAGYGFDLYGCLRFTPQLGLGWMTANGQQANESMSRAKESAYATCLSGSVKVSFSFTKNFGIYIAPEYISQIATTGNFDRFTDTTGKYVSANSSTKELTNWTKGFRIRIGLEVSI